MQRDSFGQLCEVFDFFVKKVLEPMEPSNIQKLSPKITPVMAQQISSTMTLAITNNSVQEFQAIVTEKNVQPKLQKLDQLKSSDGLKVDMRAFTFTPQDPEYIKGKIAYDAKLELIKKLKSQIDFINAQIDQLSLRDQTASDRVAEGHARVQDLEEKLTQVKNGEKL